ncbi:MAG: methyltransferase domain-containing protein [Planctomycetota bacterium]
MSTTTEAARTTLPTVLDLGCGPRKVPGSYGVDRHAYDGVDQVLDLDSPPWPLPSDHFTEIHARHVIEHVHDVVAFMQEVRRIAAPGCTVTIEAPHFSSLNAFRDPTHKRYLASSWYEPFTQAYLAAQNPGFEHASTSIKHSSGLTGAMSKVLCKLFGVEWWEKRMAFVLRARNFTTVLRVVS